MVHRDFTRGRVLSGVLAYGLPLSLGMTSHAVFNLVDLLLVGRLGPGAMAAVHVGSTINFLPMIVGNGVGVSAVAMVSSLLGAGDLARAQRVANHSHLLMLAVGLIFTALGMALAGPLVRFQWAEAQVAEEGGRYLLIMSGGTLTMFLLMQVCVALRAAGQAAWTVALLVGSNLLNLLLDVILIFGVEDLGIPALGVEGAAWATVGARLVGGLAGVALLLRRSHPLALRWPSRSGGREHVTRLLLLGFPQSLQMVVRALVVVYLTRVAGALAGPGALDALGVGTRLDTMILFGAAGWAAAATAIVGQCLGAGQKGRALRAARLAALSSGLLATGGAVLLAVGAGTLLRLFVASPVAGSEDVYGRYLEVGTGYLTIAVAAHPFTSACLALTGAFNGAGVTVRPMLFDSVAFLLVLVPVVSWIATYQPQLGLEAVWVAVVAVNAALTGVYLWFLEKGRWRRRPA